VREHTRAPATRQFPRAHLSIGTEATIAARENLIHWKSLAVRSLPLLSRRQSFVARDMGRSETCVKGSASRWRAKQINCVDSRAHVPRYANDAKVKCESNRMAYGLRRAGWRLLEFFFLRIQQAKRFAPFASRQPSKPCLVSLFPEFGDEHLFGVALLAAAPLRKRRFRDLATRVGSCSVYRERLRVGRRHHGWRRGGGVA
jgi:hypothetical protein